MRVSVLLYTTDKAVVNSECVRACLNLVDFTALRVSRTIGPANYFAINTVLFETGAANFPPEDICGKRYTDSDAVCALVRANSMLSISFENSTRIGAIVRAISEYSSATSSFFSSQESFRVGPIDLIEFFENDHAEHDFRLVGVGQFCFSIASDNYPGDVEALRDCLEVVEPFGLFRRDLETIVGPLTLRVET